jgi:hypothetical protein
MGGSRTPLSDYRSTGMAVSRAESSTKFVLAQARTFLAMMKERSLGVTTNDTPRALSCKAVRRKYAVAQPAEVAPFS